MTLSGWSVLLILYVAADFANPLMPGAVTFLDGSVQAVHVERARLADVPSASAIVPSPGGIEVGRSDARPAAPDAQRSQRAGLADVGPARAAGRVRSVPVLAVRRPLARTRAVASHARRPSDGAGERPPQAEETRHAGDSGVGRHRDGSHHGPFAIMVIVGATLLWW